MPNAEATVKVIGPITVVQDPGGGVACWFPGQIVRAGTGVLEAGEIVPVYIGGTVRKVPELNDEVEVVIHSDFYRGKFDLTVTVYCYRRW